MKLIPLTKGKFAKVDDQDFEWLSQWKWYCNFYGYANRCIQMDGKRRTIWMHREVNHTPTNMITDHINHDTLDNQRVNLRDATDTNNLHNARKRKNGTSNFKGVYWYSRLGKWCARFKGDGNAVLMYFDIELEAACAYNIIATRFAGEYACVNTFQNRDLPIEVSRTVKQRVSDYLDKGLHVKNTSGFKGVSWHKGSKKWAAYYSREYLGLFASKDAAAEAYTLRAHQTLPTTTSNL